MKTRLWQGLILAISIVAIGATALLISRSSLPDTTARSSQQLPNSDAPSDSVYPRLLVATPTSTAAAPPPASPTPTLTGTPVAAQGPGEGFEDEEEDPIELTIDGVQAVVEEPEIILPSTTPTPEPSPTMVATSLPASTATPAEAPPQSTPAQVPTAIPPMPTAISTSLPTATATPTATPSLTPTATATASASRTPTPSPTASGPYSFRVLPTGDFQVFRGDIAQIAGTTPAGGIKLYLDGQEYHTPAGGQLRSGTLLAVRQQSWQGGNTHVTTFGGSADLAITQTISYSAGASFLTLKWDISSSTHPDARFFYAFDSSLEGNDLGDPYYEPQSGKVGVWNPGLHNRYMGLQPVAPLPSAYSVGAVNGPNGWAAVEASTLKSLVGTGTGNYLIALQWNNRLRSDMRWSIEVRLSFALPG